VAGAGGLLLAAPLCYPLITGRLFTRDDLAALHLPFRYLYAQSLDAGEFLLWTPAYHAGYFLHGAGEAGMAHPLHLALYAWLPLGIAFNLEIISSYLMLFAGMYLLWRALGVSGEGSIVGGMLSAFSGFTVFNIMHVNHIATLAHAPWLVLACHRIVGPSGGQQQVAWSALAALITGSQLLTGHPQYMWITLIAVIAFCAWQWRPPAGITPLLLLAGAALLGALIGAVQLLPSIEFFGDSARAAWSREDALSFSLPPLNIIQLWTPFAFEYRVFAPGADQMPHEFLVYNGAFCTAALMWIAIRWRQLPHRRLAAALMVFAVMALLLAFGRYGGIYPLLVDLPVVSGLRGSSRHIVLFQFALAGLAAIAFDDLVGLTRTRARVNGRRLFWLLVPVLLAIVTVAAVAALSGSAWAAGQRMRLASADRAILSIVPLLLISATMALAARGQRWAVPLVVLLAVADLGTWGYSYAFRWGPLRSIDELAQQAQVPSDAAPGDVIPSVPGGREHLAILRGLRLTTGYTGLYPRSTLNFGTAAVERLAGIVWRGDGDRWTRVTDPLPRARMIARAEVSDRIADDLARLDVARTALVAAPLQLSGEPGSATVRVDRPGHLEVDTSAAGRQLVVFTERFHRGWHATIDGEAAQPIAVYADFLGLVVDAGTHRVTIEFAPLSFTRGSQISVMALALTALIGLAALTGMPGQRRNDSKAPGRLPA
jgi:hypothetical protein